MSTSAPCPGWSAPDHESSGGGPLQEKAGGLGFTFCQGCGYCVPECPEEIDISEVFRLQVFHNQYGMTDYAKSAYRNRYAAKVGQ